MSYVLKTGEPAAIFELAEKLTGTCQTGTFRRDVLLQNVCRRITATGMESLARYLAFIDANPQEFQHLISALTIHTTSWFREEDHFDRTWAAVATAREYTAQSPLMVFSAACSTGKEVYSFALMLEHIRSKNPQFDYRIFGMDLDPISIDMANRAIYPCDDIHRIPTQYKPYLRIGSGKSENFFTFTKNLRDRCRFLVGDLRTVQSSLNLGQMRREPLVWDLIICRNALIYFQREEVNKIINAFVGHLAPEGALCLGHSEAIEGSSFGLKSLGHAVYQRTLASPPTNASKGRILVVDDSAVIRKVIVTILHKGGFETLEADSAAQASVIIKQSKIDVISLDINMPEKDGPTWLAEERRRGMRTPVIIVSDANPNEAKAVIGALERGAQDYIEKKTLHERPHDVAACFRALIGESRKIKPYLAKSKQTASLGRLAGRPDLILIGASTGGTEALTTLLRNMPKNSPPILVVQHITPNFAEAFATRLAEAAGLVLGKMEDHESLEEGHIYLALGGYHIGVKRRHDGSFESVRSNTSLVQGHRPSVDFLFYSAQSFGDQVLGILLTGMGRDGADGLLKLRKAGAHTIAQDEQSSVVFGMPREAIQCGAAQFVGNLQEIRRVLDEQNSMPRSRARIPA